MVGSLFKMSSNDVVHRIEELESRMDRVCKFLSGMYWSSYLEGFKTLEQRVNRLDKSLDEKISEVKDKIETEFKTKVDELEAKMEYEVKSKVDRLETKIMEEDRIKDSERKKELAKELFSIGMKDNMAQIKVKDENIRGVSSDCLEGLSLIMKEYGSVSLFELFKGCKNLAVLNFPSIFNTSSVTDMSCMFLGCSSLTSLDLSTFNTSNVTDMSCMFGQCHKLSSLDLSTFNTSNATDMNGMFYECKSLTSLDISTFNTSNALYMNHMFYGCSSLNSLDLSTFNTSSVTNVNGMFDGCSKLKEVHVKDERTKSALPSDVSVKTK